MLLSSDIKLKHNDEQCTTVHPILLEIKSKEHLLRLRGRYYRLPNQREYSIITGKEKELIGQKILLKSPTTCASKNGICMACYGQLYYTNKNIGIGSYAAAKITEPISQNVLSSKHLLTTISEKIEFNQKFYNFFSINANEVILNTENEDIDLNDYSLLLIGKNITTIYEYDDVDFNRFVTIFHVKNKKTGEIIEIREKSEKELYISPELVDLLNLSRHQKDIYELDFSKIDDESRIFVLAIENNGLTKPLYDIMKLLDRSDHLGSQDVNSMTQSMLDLLIKSNINIDSVHAEVLMYSLIRSKDDVLERPNFNRYGNKANYQILTVESALEKHPSVLIGLSFQDLNRQFTNPLTFRKRGTSFIDPFFKERL